MAPALASLQIPAITSGQAPSLAALRNPFLFLNSTTSTVFDVTLAQYAVGTAGLGSFALISNDGAYGKGERAAFTAALAARGVTPVADEVVAVGQKDFPTELTAIRQRGAGALFIGAEEVQSGLIAPQARALGITATLLGGAPFGTDVYLNTAGAEAAEGTIFSTPYPTNDENEASRQFAAAYQAAFGEPPEFHGAKAYDGARILIQALRDSDLATGRALADAIRSVRFTGPAGPVPFDDEGVGIHRPDRHDQGRPGGRSHERVVDRVEHRRQHVALEAERATAASCSRGSGTSPAPGSACSRCRAARPGSEVSK